jgi:hypothetical protein
MTRASSMALRLRSATLEDLELLRRWDEQPHVTRGDDGRYEAGSALG